MVSGIPIGQPAAVESLREAHVTVNKSLLNLDTPALFWLNAGGLLLEDLVQNPQEPEAQDLSAVSVVNARAAARN